MRAIFRIAALLCMSIVATPPAAHAQQSGKVWRIGLLATFSTIPALREVIFQPLLAGLHDLGYVEGQNIVLEFRTAEGHLDRLPKIAAELVALPVDVLISPVCGAPLDAAMRATKAIPIVVPLCDDDMVETGVVASLAKPGGNVTGLSKMTPDLTAKRLDLLKEMVPAASDVAVLWDSKFAASLADWSELRSRASGAGVTLHPVEAHLSPDLDEAFTVMTRERVQAVLTFSDVLTYNVPDRVATLAAAHRLPLMSPFRETTKAGGLMSYGPSIPAMVRYTAVYLDKIFKGKKPSELPIERPPKIEMLINLKTAKELGIEVPTGLLVRADEVIE